MFLKSTRIVLINTFSLLSLPTNTWSQFRERSIQCFQLSVCLCVLCSDDNNTKCSKLLRASLRGTSGMVQEQHLTDLAIDADIPERTTTGVCSWSIDTSAIILTRSAGAFVDLCSKRNRSTYILSSCNITAHYDVQLSQIHRFICICLQYKTCTACLGYEY